MCGSGDKLMQAGLVKERTKLASRTEETRNGSRLIINSFSNEMNCNSGRGIREIHLFLAAVLYQSPTVSWTLSLVSATAVGRGIVIICKLSKSVL